jgi:hypothetical protein
MKNAQGVESMKHIQVTIVHGARPISGSAKDKLPPKERDKYLLTWYSKERKDYVSYSISRRLAVALMGDGCNFNG